MSESEHPQRRIRSFVLRNGRMTPGQAKAFERGWSRWGLEPDQPLDYPTVFGCDGPRVFEIGFGMGHSLAEMAAASPEQQFVGVEVHRPGVGRLLHSIEERELNNIRIYCHDAVEVLTGCVADASLDKVQIYFPDPWHKKKHHKRRLIQPEFVSLLGQKLKPGGVLHLATDWQHYAEQMMEVLSAHGDFANSCEGEQYAPRPDWRPLTKFENRGERLGHGVWDLIFTRR